MLLLQVIDKNIHSDSVEFQTQVFKSLYKFRLWQLDKQSGHRGLFSPKFYYCPPLDCFLAANKKTVVWSDAHRRLRTHCIQMFDCVLL